MEKKTGMKVKLASASWWPWQGLRLSNLQFSLKKSPDMVSTVQDIYVELDYKAIASFDFKVASVEVVNPLIELEVGQLKGLLGSGTESLAKVANVSPVVPPVVASNLRVGQAKRPSAVVRRPKEKPPIIPGVKPKERPVVSLSRGGEAGWPYRVEIRGAAFKLQGEKEAVLAVGPISLQLPYKGQKGYLKVDSLKLAGDELLQAGLFELSAEKSGLLLKSKSLRLFNEPAVSEAFLRKNGSFKGGVKLVGGEALVVKEWGQVSYEKVAVTCEFGGNLKQPSTWLSGWRALLNGVQMKHPSKSVQFNSIRMAGLLGAKGGQLLEIKCLGDDLSVVGSGAFGVDGGMLGEFRVIATEDEAKNVSRFAGGLQVHFPMKPLRSSEFRFNDVAVKGTLWEPEFKSGNRWRNLREVLSSAEDFLRDEGEETLRGE